MGSWRLALCTWGRGMRSQRWVACALLASACSWAGAQSTMETQVTASNVTMYPHEISRIPPIMPKTIPGSGRPAALITMMYQVDTQDWDQARQRATAQLAVALGVPVDYFTVTLFAGIRTGPACTPLPGQQNPGPETLKCKDSVTGKYLLAPGIGGASSDWSLENADPRQCVPLQPSVPVVSKYSSKIALSSFNPVWTSPDELEQLSWQTEMCVSKINTSLLIYPLVLSSLFVTGFRDTGDGVTPGNANVQADKSRNITFDLWIVGDIPITWATFLMSKFQLNGTIPLPLYQPEVLDVTAKTTGFINISRQILSIKQNVNGRNTGFLNTLPVCFDPPIAAKGCYRIDHMLYEYPPLTEYKLKNLLLWSRTGIVTATQDVYENEFSTTAGPWPVFDWLLPKPSVVFGPWTQYTHPQKQYVYNESCVRGNPCPDPPQIAPSQRYLHSAILYTTWDFQSHAFRYLCNSDPGCGSDCLTNLTCLNGFKYFDNNFYFSSGSFKGDDNGVIPYLTLSDQDCPASCCSNRRMCMRVTDVLGYKVPFNAPMMLIFGGRTYQHKKDDMGRLIYHNCEHIPPDSLRPEWRSCQEMVVNDLWRYNILEDKWEFIKQDALISPTTGKSIGFPKARYAHASSLVQVIDPRDPGQKRQYMYIYGGIGPQCAGSVCSDVWQYEIGWAAQAYYPKLVGGDWMRGNTWQKLKNCPYGGRYHHHMVTTSSQEYMYVYGGQTLGGYQQTLLRYRVATDLWEDVGATSYGRQSLIRYMYDYTGQAVPYVLATDQYDPKIDYPCNAAYSFTGIQAHCRVCPTCGLQIKKLAEGGVFPAPRGDHGFASLLIPGDADESLIVFGGFRTTWGSGNDPSTACPATTASNSESTTTTLAQIMSTTRAAKTTAAAVETTTRTAKTTSTRKGDVPNIGTFPTIGGEAGALVTKPTTAPTTAATTSIGSSTAETEAGATTTSESSTIAMTEITAESETTTGSPSSTTAGMRGGFTTSTARTTQLETTTTKRTTTTETTTVNKGGPVAGCNPKYYFGDLWMYNAQQTLWSEVAITGEGPSPRRGHKMILRRPGTNDTQLVVFGGNNQDKCFSDLWTLNVLRSGQELAWARMDTFYDGPSPPAVSYHSLVYVADLDLVVLFGGLHWNQTDVTVSDALRDIDRRCLKEAQALSQNYKGLAEPEFMAAMAKLCAQPDIIFCCILTNTPQPLPSSLLGYQIRSPDGTLNISAVGSMCRYECIQQSFYPEFYPIMQEGVWTFSGNRCPNNCNGNGYCDLSLCICDIGWYGKDCSFARCPGSFCYAHPNTKEQSCIECSSHGRCIDSQCHCDPGWGYDDCSTPLCDDNCSSTPSVTQGICIEDFPVHQCHCLGRWSGPSCNQSLCLNGCSDKGECKPTGECICRTGFYGPDCSLFTIPIAD